MTAEPSTAGGEAGGKTGASSPSMRDSLHALMKRLAEKRREGNRPEDLSVGFFHVLRRDCIVFFMSMGAILSKNVHMYLV